MRFDDRSQITMCRGGKHMPRELHGARGHGRVVGWSARCAAEHLSHGLSRALESLSIVAHRTSKN